MARHVGPQPLIKDSRSNPSAKGVEPLTKDSRSNPLTNCTILGPPDLVCQGCLRSENDVITSQLRLIPTSDLFHEASANQPISSKKYHGRHKLEQFFLPQCWRGQVRGTRRRVRGWPEVRETQVCPLQSQGTARTLADVAIPSGLKARANRTSRLKIRGHAAGLKRPGMRQVRRNNQRRLWSPR
jgi:hypothetical protein